MDKDLYDLPPEELKKIPTVCGSLREALGSLDKDRDFLKAGGVFDDDFIDSYIELKMTEVITLRAHPAPGRVRDVLLGLIVSLKARSQAMPTLKGRSRKGRPFSLGERRFIARAPGIDRSRAQSIQSSPRLASRLRIRVVITDA